VNEIHRVLSKAAWRVGIIDFLRGWVLAAAAILAAAILLRFVEQIFAFTDVVGTVADPSRLLSSVLWTQFAYWGAGANVVFALGWAIFLRPKAGAVARRVDEGGNLREALSTALCVAGKNDPWSLATVQSASRTARGVNVSQAVPITAPRFWPVVVALGLTLAVVYMAMPRVDVFGWFETRQVAKKTVADKVNAVREVRDIEKKIEELTAKIPSLEKSEANESAPGEKPEPKTAEEIRKAAISDLTKLTDRIDALKTGASAKKLAAMQNQLKNLKQPPGATGELGKSLAKGDFSQAKAEIEKMKAKLAGDGMSAESKDKAAEQMKQMAEQIEKLAQNQEQLKKTMEQAGINPDAIKDAKSAKGAIQNASNLTDEQKNAMQQMVEAAMQSKEGMQQMAAAMQKVSEAMKESQSEGQKGEEGQQQAGEAAQQLSQQMSEMQQIQQEMEMAEATMNEARQAMEQLGKQCEGGDQPGMGECKGGLGNKGEQGSETTRPWTAGTSEQEGSGRGGPGLGQGGRPGEARAEFELDKKNFIGAKGDGPIVSSRLVEGESIRGESKADFARAVAKGDQGSTEAIENNTVPREYHDAIKTYFGRLKGKVQKSAGEPEKKEEPKKEEVSK